jgi:hypothetical protein
MGPKIEFRKDCWFDSGQGTTLRPSGFAWRSHAKGDACPAKPLGEDGLFQQSPPLPTHPTCINRQLLP